MGVCEKKVIRKSRRNQLKKMFDTISMANFNISYRMKNFNAAARRWACDKFAGLTIF
jgi:hypothetical protein